MYIHTNILTLGRLFKVWSYVLSGRDSSKIVSISIPVVQGLSAGFFEIYFFFLTFAWKEYLFESKSLCSDDRQLSVS